MGAQDPDRLGREFAGVFGFLAVAAPGGAAAFRIDDWCRRFLVEPAEVDGLRAAGLVARDPSSYDTAAARLRFCSIPLRPGSPAECEYRGVRRYVSFADPAGSPLKLAAGPAVPGSQYASPLVPGGFRTGHGGLGRAVLILRDRQACVDFYVDSLGFVVSDTSEQETTDGLAEATFLHINRRHHTIAIAQRPIPSPLPSRLGHVMVEVNEFDAVGMASDRALDAQMPIRRSLGRHPNDRMFSFYATTSAGFDVEMGAGAVEVGDDWEVHHYQQFSAWGPPARARQLKAMRNTDAKREPERDNPQEICPSPSTPAPWLVLAWPAERAGCPRPPRRPLHRSIDTDGDHGHAPVGARRRPRLGRHGPGAGALGVATDGAPKLAPRCSYQRRLGLRLVRVRRSRGVPQRRGARGIPEEFGSRTLGPPGPLAARVITMRSSTTRTHQ